MRTRNLPIVTIPAKRFGCSILLFCMIFISQSVFAQLSTEGVRPVDSAYATEWLISPVIHSYNVHSAVGIGPIITWDAGNGLYPGIAEYAVAWSHTDKVSADTAALIDAIKGAAYKTFDLTTMPDLQAYSDSIGYWLSSLGIPVGFNNSILNRPTVYPNPTNGKIWVRPGESPGIYSIEIRNITGQLVESFQVEPKTSNQTFVVDMSHYPKGVYVVHQIYDFNIATPVILY